MTAKKKRAASVGELSDLHKMVAVYLTHRIKESMPDAEDELELNEETGEYEKPFKMPLSSAELGNAITFLKHNEISAEPDDESLSGLKEEFTDDFELRRAAKAKQILTMSTEELEQRNWV